MWILLLQEFDLEIKDMKGCDNLVADHLSRMEDQEEKSLLIEEALPGEKLMQVNSVKKKPPWYADFVNYLACKIIQQT